MMDVDIKGDGRYASSRRAAYKYSIDSWKKWCDKNDCELFVLNDLVLDNDKMGICWQRYYLFDILEANDIKYNQILMVENITYTKQIKEIRNYTFIVLGMYLIFSVFSS